MILHTHVQIDTHVVYAYKNGIHSTDFFSCLSQRSLKFPVIISRYNLQVTETNIGWPGLYAGSKDFVELTKISTEDKRQEATGTRDWNIDRTLLHSSAALCMAICICPPTH